MRRLTTILAALFRVGFAEAVAYRGEVLIWFLSTSMPLVMLLLWARVAEESPVGRFDQKDFVAYFLVTLIVRLLSGTWVAWQMTFEVRQGALAQRLLRPLHPFLAYAIENLAYWPLRVVYVIPVIVALLLSPGRAALSHDPRSWIIAFVGLIGAWAIQFLFSVMVGTLCLYWQSAMSVFDLWLGCYFVFSGYLVPLELFPRGLREALAWSPFPYMLALPVETVVGLRSVDAALAGLGVQWLYVAGLLALALSAWRRGVLRFQAFGG